MVVILVVFQEKKLLYKCFDEQSTWPTHCLCIACLFDKKYILL